MLRGVIQSKSKAFLVFCFCFLLGIACGSFFMPNIAFVSIYSGFFVLITLFIVFWDTVTCRFFLVCMSCFLFGVIRCVISFSLLDFHGSSELLYGEQEITGFVSAEPDIRQGKARYIVTPKNSNIAGKIFISVPNYPQYAYGDQLNIVCKRLEKPEPIETFRYDMYLARFGVSYICVSPAITKIGSGDGNSVLAHIFSLKQIVAERITILWHEPYAGFMAGLLYGYRGGLGSLNDVFAQTGVTHIIAISGYNITIIATILITLCIHAYIPRKKAYYIIVFGIIIFVIFAGASASVVRAGIMGILVLYAKHIGRARHILPILCITAVIMSLHNPLILLWDAGFQLSFVATVGLIYLCPIIDKKLQKIPDFFGITAAFSATIAAIISTLPLILFQFGRLSLVAPLVNMLILWTIPYIMLFGFFSVVTSFVFFPFGLICSYIAWLGMAYVVIIVRLFADRSFTYMTIPINFFSMFCLYLLLFYILIMYDKKQRIKNI